MPYSSVVISSGHGKYVAGAEDILDEVEEARRVVDRVADLLRARDVNVKTFHDNTSHDQNTNLQTIVAYHNAQERQLDVSVHFNCNVHTSKPVGSECWYMTQEELASSITEAIAASGLIDRGAKYSSGLYFLKHTEMPSILIEVCFVDSVADADIYDEEFEGICTGIADVLGGAEVVTEPPPDTGVDPEPPTTPRPLIGKGDYGNNVREIQAALNLEVDGDFGPKTEAAVETYQASKNLSVDGLVGSQTWAALGKDYELPEYPPRLPLLMPQRTIDTITGIAGSSAIARYSWRDRGTAPTGYTKGMAVAYAQAVARFNAGDPLAREMAKANTGNDAIDALSWYNSNFASLGMHNDELSLDTLRHLYVLIMGLGMRESSGKHCCGRDQSATNTTSDTAEAGLFQTSWNAHSCCTDFINLFDQYEVSSKQGYELVFSENVSCSTSDWKSYGSGDGYQFQEVCKWSPTFAVETCAIGLRNLRQHWGPINRKEAELRREADDLFRQVERALDGGEA